MSDFNLHAALAVLFQLNMLETVQRKTALSTYQQSRKVSYKMLCISFQNSHASIHDGIKKCYTAC